MLLANRTVAESVSKIKINKQPVPFPYRVHNTPDEDKLKPFIEFAKKFGHRFDISSPDKIAESFNSMLEEVQGQAGATCAGATGHPHDGKSYLYNREYRALRFRVSKTIAILHLLYGATPMCWHTVYWKAACKMRLSLTKKWKKNAATAASGSVQLWSASGQPINISR